jgi:hypothetical protein
MPRTLVNTQLAALSIRNNPKNLSTSNCVATQFIAAVVVLLINKGCNVTHVFVNKINCVGVISSTCTLTI